MTKVEGEISKHSKPNDKDVCLNHTECKGGGQGGGGESSSDIFDKDLDFLTEIQEMKNYVQEAIKKYKGRR